MMLLSATSHTASTECPEHTHTRIQPITVTMAFSLGLALHQQRISNYVLVLSDFSTIILPTVIFAHFPPLPNAEGGSSWFWSFLFLLQYFSPRLLFYSFLLFLMHQHTTMRWSGSLGKAIILSSIFNPIPGLLGGWQLQSQPSYTVQAVGPIFHPFPIFIRLAEKKPQQAIE